MAEIKFSCQGCGSHLEIEGTGVGLMVNCPTCDAQVRVPHQDVKRTAVAVGRRHSSGTKTSSQSDSSWGPAILVLLLLLGFGVWKAIQRSRLAEIDSATLARDVRRAIDKSATSAGSAIKLQAVPTPSPQQPAQQSQGAPILNRAPQINSGTQQKSPTYSSDPIASLKEEVLKRIDAYYAKPPKRTPANNGLEWERLVDLKYDVKTTQSLVSPYVATIWMRERPFVQFDGKQAESIGDHEYGFSLALQDGRWVMTDARWRLFLSSGDLLSDWEPTGPELMQELIRNFGL